MVSEKGELTGKMTMSGGFLWNRNDPQKFQTISEDVMSEVKIAFIIARKERM